MLSYGSGNQSLHLADHHDDFTLDFDGGWIFDDNGLHGGVCRLETNFPVFLVEVFQGGFIAVVQPYRRPFLRCVLR